MDAPELPDEEVEGELIDPEDVPLCETVWVARHLDFAFDGRLDTSQVIPLAVGIDTSEFVSCVAVCILHSKNTWTRASLNVRMGAVALDAVAPDVVFLGPELDLAGLSDVGATIITNVTSLPPMIRVTIDFLTQEEATEPLTGSLTVMLTFRRHAPVRYRLRSPERVARPTADVR